MHRTVNGLVIIAVIGFSAIRALFAASAGAGVASALVTIALLAVGAVGLLAVRAMVQERRETRALVTGWAMAVLGYVVFAEAAVGFLRQGVTERLFATGLIAALLAAVVVSVPRVALRNDARSVSP